MPQYKISLRRHPPRPMWQVSEFPKSSTPAVFAGEIEIVDAPAWTMTDPQGSTMGWLIVEGEMSLVGGVSEDPASVARFVRSQVNPV